MNCQSAQGVGGGPTPGFGTTDGGLGLVTAGGGLQVGVGGCATRGTGPLQLGVPLALLQADSWPKGQKRKQLKARVLRDGRLFASLMIQKVSLRRSAPGAKLLPPTVQHTRQTAAAAAATATVQVKHRLLQKVSRVANNKQACKGASGWQVVGVSHDPEGQLEALRSRRKVVATCTARCTNMACTTCGKASPVGVKLKRHAGHSLQQVTCSSSQLAAAAAIANTLQM
jgi:hypothetical protein